MTFDVLIVLSKGVGSNFAETKIVTELVKTLEYFVQCSDSDLKQLVTCEVPDFVDKVKPIQEKIGKVLANCAQYKIVASELRKTESIDRLFKMLLSTTYPPENFRFRRIALAILTEVCNNCDISMVDYLHKKVQQYYISDC